MLQYDTPKPRPSIKVNHLKATFETCRNLIAATESARPFQSAFPRISTPSMTPRRKKRVSTSVPGSSSNSRSTKDSPFRASLAARSARSAKPLPPLHHGKEPAPQLHKKEPAALVRQLVPKFDGSDLVAKLPEPDSSVIYPRGNRSGGRNCYRKGSVALILTNLSQVGPDFDRRVSAYFREGRV